MLALTNRQEKILSRLIRIYIRKAEPVSSGELARFFNFSSATIRNELRHLEELGYLHQPHSSAGRVPTDRAYRWLVDQILRNLRADRRRQQKIERAYRRVEHELGELINQTLEILSSMSGYLAWAVHPDLSEFVISRLELAPVAERSLMLILVTRRGVIKNRLIQLPLEPSELDLDLLRERLNNYLSNRSLQSIDYRQLRQIFTDVVNFPQKLMTELFLALTDLTKIANRLEVKGEEQLLRLPEFQQAAKVAEVLDAAHSLNEVIDLDEERTSLTVTIGSENPKPELRPCSLIHVPYRIKDKPSGVVGVLGPTRLSYRETIPLVETIGRALSKILTEHPTQA